MGLPNNETDHVMARYRVRQAQDTVWHLQRALETIRQAGAPRTCKRVQLALSSARGAVRNARSREVRMQ